MALYDVSYRGTQSNTEQVERIEADSELEAQIKLRNQLREEGVSSLIFDAILIPEEVDKETQTLNNITSKIKNAIKVVETRIRNDYAGMTEKGQLQGLKEALIIIKEETNED